MYYTSQPIPFFSYAIRHPHFVSLLSYEVILFYGSKLILNVFAEKDIWTCKYTSIKNENENKKFCVAIIFSYSNALHFLKINKQLVFWIGTRLHAHSPHNILILNFCWDTYWTAGYITGIFNDNPIEQNFNRIEHSNTQLLIDIFENLWKKEVAFITFSFLKRFPLFWCACKRQS